MKKVVSTLILSLVFLFHINAQIDIADARILSEGTSVTIQGIVTNGSELGIIRHLQDATGAIAVYPGTGSVGDFPGDVKRGDIVKVTGTLKIFNELLEVDAISSYEVISSNNPLPNPMVIEADDVDEALEAHLVTINNVIFDNAGGIFSVGNYTFNSNGQSAEVYIRSNHALIGTTIPLANISLTGIVSQFNAIYQLLPRDADDIDVSDPFYVTKTPNQVQHSTSDLTIEWTTNTAGNSKVTYGTTVDMTEELILNDTTTDHILTLTNLSPSEFYYVKAFSDNGNSEVSSPVKIFSTASISSGTVKVYFNNGVDGSVATGTSPDGLTGAAIEAAIIDKINNAQTSIDVSVYNNSRTSIVGALTAAHDRGVIVRYITDDQTFNSALSNPTPPFTVFRGNPGSPLMHNKYFVFDANSDDDAWIITGSTNMTDNNIATDYNNAIFIQDKSLAKAYTWEFNEMWGSPDPIPGVFNVRFGENKLDDTPHDFTVNGTHYECYFSPSDNTTLAIIDAIETAEEDLNFQLLTFTNNELGAAVKAAHDRGVDVKGIIDNVNDQGSEFAFLQSSGVDVSMDNTTVVTHHKLGIVDANNTTSDPIVITGSHNWTAAAEQRNDENTLIIHNATIANIYTQEFNARWCEAKGMTDCISVNINAVDKIDGFDVQVFPTITNGETTIAMELAETKDVAISLWNSNGQLFQTTIEKNISGSKSIPFSLNGMPNGRYILSFQIDGLSISQAIIKL